MKRFIGFGLLILLVAGAKPGPAAAKPAARIARAGVASVAITPESPVWMAGYASRTRPSAGKLQELYAKALAIEDSRGGRIVIVTADVLGLPRSMTSTISEHAAKSYGLRREQILFNASHTHTGPVLSGSLAGAYDLDAQQSAAVDRYSKILEEKILGLIGAALRDLAPARLSHGKGEAPFAMNRRQMTPNGMIIGVNPDGVVDREVPVLKVEAPDGRLRAVVFGYACHNTTLTGEFYEFSGDYAGFAQAEIEKAHPGAKALFVTGCGADINPYPRSRLELAREHGSTLARSVEAVLSQGGMTPVEGALKSVIGRVDIALAPPPTREEFQARLKDANPFRRRHAERMLARLDRDGKLMSHYPYTIQVLRIGNLKLVGLAGEVVTDYSLRLRKELAGNVWVAGYSNDLCSYIPSARMYSEGGYEVIESMIYYDLPGPYTPELEEKIVGRVRELARIADK